MLASSQVLCCKLCSLQRDAALVLRVHAGSKGVLRHRCATLACLAVEQLHVLRQPGVLVQQERRVGCCQRLQGQCCCVEAVELRAHAVAVHAVGAVLQTHNEKERGGKQSALPLAGGLCKLLLWAPVDRFSSQNKLSSARVPSSHLLHCLLAFMLQLHLVHLVASNQLQHAEAVTILRTKLGTVLLLQADRKRGGKDASQQPDIKPSLQRQHTPVAVVLDRNRTHHCARLMRGSGCSWAHSAAHTTAVCRSCASPWRAQPPGGWQTR